MKRTPRVLDSLTPIDSDIANSQSVAAKRKSAWWRWLLRLSFGVALIMMLARRHDTASLWQALRGVSMWFLASSVAFYWLGQLLSAWKWQLLLRAVNAKVALSTCCRLYAVGMFWNLWMPTNIGGDVVRALRVAPFCGGKSVASSSVLAERLTGLAALLLTAFFGLILQFAGGAPGQSATLALRPLVFVAFTLFLFFVIARFANRRLVPTSDNLSPWQRKLRAFMAALAFYSSPSSRRALYAALAISIAFQASQVLLNIGLARVVGLQISATTFWWLVPSLALASLVPLGIGGLGVREAAAIQLLSGSGAPAATVIAWSLLWQTTVWLASLPGVFWATQRTENR